MKRVKFLPCDSIHLGISEIIAQMAKTYDFTDKQKSFSPWLAKIIGLDTKYGYKREFVKKNFGARMYNGKIQMLTFELENGSVYQFKNFLLLFVRPEAREGFFGVDGKGQVIELGSDQVREYLNMRTKK